MSARIAPGRQRGFTLLEAIVTLVIVSMLVTVLMQALGQAMSLRTRLLRFDGENRTAALQDSWFRESVGGVQRDVEPAPDAVLGTHDWLEFVTPAPLAATGFSNVRWWLDGGQLHYADRQVNDVVIVPGPLQDAGFTYLDESGAWVQQWPWSQHKRMPRMIRFSAGTARGALDWIVPVMADGQDPEMLKLDVGSNNDL